jgi:hypothetical protein
MIHASLHWPEEDPACGPWQYLMLLTSTTTLPTKNRHCSSRNLHRHQVRLPGPPEFPTPGMSHLCPSPNFARWKRIPKWEPRSRRGQFLGVSPDHAETVMPPKPQHWLHLQPVPLCV